MAAANAFALLGSEESQDVAGFIAAEQAMAKAAKEVADALARKKHKAAPKKQQQIDRAPNPRMMRAKRIILPYHVRRSDIVIRKEKKEDGDSRSNNNGSVEKKSDLSVQKKVEQNGNGQAITDNKSSRVVSQGGQRTSNPNGGLANNNYRGTNRQGNYRNYRDGNGFRPNRSNQGRRMNENKGYRSGTEGEITDDNGGSRKDKEEGWKYVGMRSRSRSSSISGDGRRGAYGHNGFRGQKHQYQRRYYNGNEDNRRGNGGNTEETIKGDNVSNQPEKNQVTEDKTDGAKGAICEPTEEHKGELRGQKDSKSKDSKTEEVQDADEAKLKRREHEAKLKEREYEAKLMTLDQYEKVLSKKKKTLDGLRQTEQQRMVTLDKEFESMQLVGKKNVAGHESEQQQGKLKKKDGADREEKARKSMCIDELPAKGAYYRARNGERPFSGRGQQDERLNPNSVTRPRNTSRNFPRQQGRNPVLDTGRKKDNEAVLDTGKERDNEAVLNTESAEDFPALTAAPLPTRP